MQPFPFFPNLFNPFLHGMHKTVSHCTCGDFPSACAIVHTPIAPKMDRAGEASLSRIRLPYRDVHKFQHDGGNAGKISKML
jgi:hypothetical protein